MLDLFVPVRRERSPLGRVPTTCQGCGADRGPLCEGCALAIRRVHDGEHEAACLCGDCGTWTRASARLGAAAALLTAREVVS